MPTWTRRSPRCEGRSWPSSPARPTRPPTPGCSSCSSTTSAPATWPASPPCRWMLGGGPVHALAPELLLKPVLVELGATAPTRGLYLMEKSWDAPGALDGWLEQASRQVAAARAGLRPEDGHGPMEPAGLVPTHRGHREPAVPPVRAPWTCCARPARCVRPADARPLHPPAPPALPRSSRGPRGAPSSPGHLITRSTLLAPTPDSTALDSITRSTGAAGLAAALAAAADSWLDRVEYRTGSRWTHLCPPPTPPARWTPRSTPARRGPGLAALLAAGAGHPAARPRHVRGRLRRRAGHPHRARRRGRPGRRPRSPPTT